MKAIHETEEKNPVAENEAAPEVVTPVRRPIPAPGPSLSFEEALDLTMKKYDNALRELAK